MRDRLPELPVTVPLWTVVECNSGEILAGQNGFGQLGENVLRAEFNKNPTSGFMDIFDLLAEQHGIEDVFLQLLLDRLGIIGVRFGGRVREDRNLRFLEFHGADGFGKRLLCVTHERSVKGGRNGQQHGIVFFRLECRMSVLHHSFGASDNHLFR